MKMYVKRRKCVNNALMVTIDFSLFFLLLTSAVGASVSRVMIISPILCLSPRPRLTRRLSFCNPNPRQRKRTSNYPAHSVTHSLTYSLFSVAALTPLVIIMIIIISFKWKWDLTVPLIKSVTRSQRFVFIFRLYGYQNRLKTKERWSNHHRFVFRWQTRWSIRLARRKRKEKKRKDESSCRAKKFKNRSPVGHSIMSTRVWPFLRHSSIYDAW